MESASLIPEIGSSCYAEGDVLQVRLTMSKGRTSFDKERLLADHPNIRRSNYETVGEPSLSFVAKVLPGAVLNPHEEEKVATAVA